MNDEEKLEYIGNICYFWTEKGDIERFVDFSMEKLREADPLLADLYARYKESEQSFTNAMNNKDLI